MGRLYSTSCSLPFSQSLGHLKRKLILCPYIVGLKVVMTKTTLKRQLRFPEHVMKRDGLKNLCLTGESGGNKSTWKLAREVS